MQSCITFTPKWISHVHSLNVGILGQWVVKYQLFHKQNLSNTLDTTTPHNYIVVSVTNNINMYTQTFRI